MRLLQICNVGEICGGTAACAWTISHALQEFQHDVFFLSEPNKRTRDAFSHCHIETNRIVTNETVDKFSPDLILLHNTALVQVHELTNNLTIQYHHSVGERTPADLHVVCSKWLASQPTTSNNVLYQPVPCPPKQGYERNRSLDQELTIGRICTPSRRKWPRELLTFYEQLAARFPEIWWEFVGAPRDFQESLMKVCNRRCRFYEAGFEARSHLWNWDALLYHHPSLTESFGRTAAEAMRAGCIPIVDAKGGFLEQIENGKNGFLFTNDAECKDAISKILDPADRKSIASSAIMTADQKFSLETFRRRFLALIQDLCHQER